MARKSRVAEAEKKINDLFAQSEKKVYTRQQLESIYNDYREVWKLPQMFNSRKFIDELVEKKFLQKISIEFEGYKATKELFLRQDSEILEIALSSFPRSYLSHYTAAFIHQLTNQSPKSVYVTFEQSPKNDRAATSELEQSNIDNAFAKPQRRSGLRGKYKGYVIIGHNGMFTGQVGVFTLNNIPVTNIERTLIDLTVRPGYGGGVQEVLNAYIAAKGRISVNKLLGILNSMNFTYPYTQAVGFYLERAGYESKFLDALHSKISEFDFYLTYDIQDKLYSDKWQIYYPNGL